MNLQAKAITNQTLPGYYRLTSPLFVDMTALNQQSKQNIQKHIDEKLPNEYEKCLIGLTAILRESWDMSQQPDIDRREKVQALSLAKECYTTKLELLTNATVVKDAITFVSKHLQQSQQ